MTNFSIQPSCNRILRCCVCEGLPVTSGSKAVVGSKVLESCDHEDERQEVLVVVDAAGGSRITVLESESYCEDDDDDEEPITVNLGSNPVPTEHFGDLAFKGSSWRIDEPVGESPLPSLPIPTSSTGPLLPPEEDFGGFHEVGTLDDEEDEDGDRDEDLEALQRKSSKWKEQWRAQQQLAAASQSHSRDHGRQPWRDNSRRGLRSWEFGALQEQQQQHSHMQWKDQQQQQQQLAQQRRLQESARRCFVQEMRQAQRLQQKILEKMQQQERDQQLQEQEEEEEEEEDLRRGLASGRVLHQEIAQNWNDEELARAAAAAAAAEPHEEVVLQRSLAEVRAEDYREGLSQQTTRQSQQQHLYHHHHRQDQSARWWYHHAEDEQETKLQDISQLTPRLHQTEAQSMQTFLKAVAEVAVNSVDRHSIGYDCGSDPESEEVHLPRSHGLASSRERAVSRRGPIAV